ncbi:MAG: hypothetical protein ACRDKE_10950 [Solirubrobacterales bacterium]
MKKLLPLVAAIAALLAVSGASASAATVVNGNFESAGTSGWLIKDVNGSAGSWYPYAGATSPVSGQTVPAAHGNSAMGDQDFISASAIYQDVDLEAGSTHELNLNYWFANNSSAWTIPNPNVFDAVTASETVQQLRVDVIKPTADPLSPDPADVLTTLVFPQVGSAQSADWTAAKADLSALAGQKVRIRAIYSDNAGPLFLGLDDVSITSKDVTAPALSAVKTSTTKYELGTKKPGFTLTFTSSEAASLTAKFTKKGPGKKSGKSCKKPTKKNAKAKNCSRWVAVKGSIALNAVLGANTLVFKGKVGGKKLGAGTYRLTLTGSDATGNKLTPVVKTFKVVPKKK